MLGFHSYEARGDIAERKRFSFMSVKDHQERQLIMLIPLFYFATNISEAEVWMHRNFSQLFFINFHTFLLTLNNFYSNFFIYPNITTKFLSEIVFPSKYRLSLLI